jgi:hypothetical protein
MKFHPCAQYSQQDFDCSGQNFGADRGAFYRIDAIYSTRSDHRELDFNQWRAQCQTKFTPGTRLRRELAAQS